MLKIKQKNSIEQNMILSTVRKFLCLIVRQGYKGPCVVRVPNGYKINSKYKTKIRVNKYTIAKRKTHFDGVETLGAIHWIYVDFRGKNSKQWDSSIMIV